MSTHNTDRFASGSVRRYPRYFRYLRSLLINGIVKTSSKQIAEALELTPSQVKADLNRFNNVGQQGYGYNVKLLYTEISRELGAGDGMSAVIIGTGIKTAKLFAERFEGRGVGVCAVFSDDTEADHSLPCYPTSMIKEVLQKTPADIAVVTEFPCGVDACELARLGIKGIWNMTQTDIRSSECDIPIINLPIGDILMGLCYEIRNKD